jgi:hypothetical protein
VIGAVHSAAGAVSILGWVLVLGCLVAAAVFATRAAWVVVAIVAAALLL